MIVGKLESLGEESLAYLVFVEHLTKKLGKLINRLPKRLLIVSTSLDGFSLVSMDD